MATSIGGGEGVRVRGVGVGGRRLGNDAEGWILSRSRCNNVAFEGASGRRLGNDVVMGVVPRSRCENVASEGVDDRRLGNDAERVVGS